MLPARDSSIFIGRVFFSWDRQIAERESTIETNARISALIGGAKGDIIAINVTMQRHEAQDYAATYISHN